MRLEQTEQARAVGQIGEETEIVSFEPTVKGAVSDPFDGEQEAERDDFAGIELGLAMFLDSPHFIIYAAEQFCDEILGRHKTRSFAVVGLPIA